MAIFDRWHLGEGKTKYTGYDEMTNVDIHSNIGVLACGHLLSTESTLVNEDCVQATYSNGNTIFFSTESGKIWRRSPAGTFSFIRTNPQGAHVNAYYSAALGQIFYATQTTLGYTDNSAFIDNWQTFAAGSEYHPMEEINLVLQIGDGRFVANVNMDLGTGTTLEWNSKALDLLSQYTITAIIDANGYALIGTQVSAEVEHCIAVLWDTYSPSWIVEDSLDENGINYFLKSDNQIFAQCGNAGNFYYWTGSTMNRFQHNRHIANGVGMQMTATKGGRPLFADGDKIYSLHQQDKDLPFVFSGEYTANGTISSIGIGNGQLIVTHSNGVDLIHATQYATAEVVSPIEEGECEDLFFEYETLEGGAITAEVKINNDVAFTPVALTHDANRHVYTLDNGVGHTEKILFYQVKIIMTPAATGTPLLKRVKTV